MSALAYGYLVRKKREQSEADAVAGDTTENKLVTAIAALVPAEVIAGHTLLLSLFTSTDDEGSTTITDEGSLAATFIVLIVATLVGYLIARGFSNWEPKDFVRAALPISAFVAWTAIIGTSALTPWVAGVLAPGLVASAGVGLAILLIAVNNRVNPPERA